MLRLFDLADGRVEVLDGDRVVASGTARIQEAFWDVRTVTPVSGDDPTRATALDLLVRELVDRADGDDGRTVRWWVTEPDPVTDALGDRLGLSRRRDLQQMRRGLPLDDAARGDRPPLPTRPIRLCREDEEAVVGVNNRAFAWHPDQANRTRAWIQGHAVAPWFDQEGFLVHEDETGRIDGFCWTKVHADLDPAVGEIFVIGVDPDSHGRGLGRGLTVAGLDHLAHRAIVIAMLYVEGTNADALAMYRRLGFQPYLIERAYQPAD